MEEREGLMPRSASEAVYPPFYRKTSGLPPFVREGDIDYPFEDTEGAGDENKMRGNWASKLDATLAAVGFSVGVFSNLWRFPYLAHRHGGLAFLLPYAAMTALVALPLALLELSLGQFSSLGILSVWKLCPLFKGIGIGMLIVCCGVGIYTNMASAWAIHFLVSAVRPTVPWASCGNAWNGPDCAVFSPSCNASDDNASCAVAAASGPAARIAANDSLPSQDYFHGQVLMLSSGLGDVGTIHWQLALYLLVAWGIVFFCSFSGVKTSGKVAYVATVVPYVILLVILVRVLTLDGSFDGILRFWAPRWECLLDITAWGDALTQAIFSLGVGYGALTTIGSYSRFHNNLQIDAWVIVAADVVTSIIAATVTYAILGFLGHELDKVLWRMQPYDNVDALLVGSPRMSFVVYASALARLPVAPLWSLLFFASVVLVVLGTELVVVETVVTAVCDEWAERLRRNHRHLLSLVALLFYAAGVALSTQAGMYFLTLLDYFLTTWTVALLAFFETMAIAWVYGVDNLMDNMKWMLKYYLRPYVYWKLLLKFVIPLILLASCGFSWATYRPLSYAEYTFPSWGSLIGVGISLCPLLAIPSTALYMVAAQKGSFFARLRAAMSPSSDWGPALAVHRAEQFPLQIPEARRPIKTARGNGTPALPSFQRETAI